MQCLYTVNIMSTTTVIYLYTAAVILATLSVVEKAIFEAKSVKQSDSEYKTLFYVKFIESE